MGRIFLVVQSAGLRAAMRQMILDQSAGALEVIGPESDAPDTPAALRAAQPDVVVLVLGFQPGRELGLLQALRHPPLGFRLVVIDTLGDAPLWGDHGWEQVDALVRAEDLATALVPTLYRLIAHPPPL